jgi:tetratricopeptide (TPR) repeat protein
LDWYKALLSGQNEEALRSVIKAAKMVPKNMVINYMHGFSALDINQPLETLKTYAQMDYIDPELLYSRLLGSWRIGYLTEALHMLADYKQELKEVRKGLKYYPDNLWLRAYEVRALAALGKTETVREVIEKSLDVVSSRGSPGDVMLYAAQELRAHGHRGAHLDTANQAVDWYRNQLQLQGANEDLSQDLAIALYTAERWDDAQAVYDELLEGDSGNIEYKGKMGLLAVRKGDRARALEILVELERTKRPYLFGRHTYMCARITALLGDKEKAVALLRKAFAQGLKYGAYLLREMDLEPLRDYKPFQELLKPKG